LEVSLRTGALGYERGVGSGDEEEEGGKAGSKDDHDESESEGIG
jgi:hypothetical protein